MLRGSEVSKDSYHSPVKKIKTIKNLQTESHQQWTMAVVLQLTTCYGKLFQAFTLRHTNELERQFTLQCCFVILNEWPRLRITLQLMVSKTEPASMSTKPCNNYVIISLHKQIELQSPHFQCFGFQFVYRSQ